MNTLTPTLALIAATVAMALPALAAEKQAPRDSAPEKRGPDAAPNFLSLLKAGRSVMFIGAHPDDESMAGPLLARAAEQSKGIVVCFTKGEGGHNRIGQERDAALGVIRASELAAACEVLGVEHRFLGYWNDMARLPDGRFNPKKEDETPEQAIARWHKSGPDPKGELVKIIRQWQPDIIITFDTEQGFTGHIEHRAAGQLATAAFGEAADAGKFPEQLNAELKVWQAQRLYYVVNRYPERFSRGLMRINEQRITEMIDATERSPKRDQTYAEIAIESVTRHESQLGKDKAALQSKMAELKDKRIALVLVRQGPGTGLLAATETFANELPNLTTLSDASIRYRVPEKPYQILERAGITAVIVDNREVKDDVLLRHSAGYSGVGALSSEKRRGNHFVPVLKGLNFEHIHDGTVQDRKHLFEPRAVPMELRVIDEFTVELYQAATPFWGLESCHRYRLLPDGVIEMTFECIPRRATFKNGYIGLFWASYINQPESPDIHFKGFDDGQPAAARWIRGITPAHGTLATHLAADDNREFAHDRDFPLTLVFNHSRHRFAEPWYFGVSHGQAFAQMFRPQDRVRLTQSPNGGGQGNPAWDFQFFIEKYELNRRYQFVMRAMLLPFESAEQVERATRIHRDSLGTKKGEE